jgi:hypothetical protein
MEKYKAMKYRLLTFVIFCSGAVAAFAQAEEVEAWHAVPLLAADTVEADSYPSLQPQEAEYSWGYGVQVLFLGSNVFYGNASNSLSNSLCMDIGFSVYYKRWLLLLQTGFLTSRTARDIMLPNAALWASGSKTHFTKHDLNVGYRIADNSWVSIAPLAGIGMADLSPNGEDIENQPDLEGQRFRSFTYSAGVQLDFLIKSLYSYSLGSGFPLRLRICYTQLHFPNDFSGGLLTTTVGIDICFRPKAVKISAIN